MQFEYEISESDYKSAQLLYHKLSGVRRRLRSAAIWTLVGAFFILVAWIDDATKWSTVLLALVGGFFVFCAFTIVFPGALSRRTFRRGYREAELAGKKYYADVNESGLEVHNDLLGWTARWAGVRPKGENGMVFILCAGGRIFIFPKRFLTAQQQEELCGLSGLVSMSRETKA